MKKVIEYLKNNFWRILAVTMISLGVILTFYSVNHVQDKIAIDAKATSIIDSLQKDNANLKDSLKHKDIAIAQYQEEILLLDKHLTNNNELIKQINKSVDEKIDMVNKYNADDVSKYFYNRYGTATSK